MNNMTIKIGTMTVPVENFKHAKAMFEAYRDGKDLASSEMKKSDGKVFEGKIQVGRVSYNGRVWDMNDKEITV